MARSMVIVESPAKARTIEKYLGKDFIVRACAGHIKDLPQRALGVNIKRDFEASYRVLPGKEKIVTDLKKAAEKSKAIYLAADPDREGEAICQHLAEELNGSSGREVHRVLLYEITKPAILEAFEHPTAIDKHKVEAQQARRILDRLVGYKISPLLWTNVRKGLSAGRVQSVALRMIVDREKEIRAFVSEEYWNFTAFVQAKNPPPFEAKAVKRKGKKFKVSNQEEADQLMEELGSSEFKVSNLTQKARKRNPVAPFITSKLQQEAARALRFTVRKTMMVAQRLYEGVELGDGESVGLITYMRTDSTRVAASALSEVREFIEGSYGKPYLPPRALTYRGKKNAQDAHEAIRPTSALREPSKVQSFLSQDEFRLYNLIWKRFVASQMKPAVFDQTDIEIEAGSTQFKAVGSVMKFDGFLKLYDQAVEDKDKLLPLVEVGEKLQVEKVVPEQKFTQPPPRYSEATLVKALEDKVIGRPSTYASILSVIQSRDYVKKEEGRFVPTELGETVLELLVEYFKELFDYDYTAKLEQNLDEIEVGKEDWLHTLKGFYLEFSRELDHARKEMKNLKKQETLAGVQCEKCGAEMVVRWGRFGKFIACSAYPECKNTREMDNAEGDEEGGKEPAETCNKCGKPMIHRKGPYGTFLACSGYPNCKNTKKTIQVDGKTKVREDTPLDEECPKCGSNLVLKHGKNGEFSACSNYPDCRYIKQETTGVTCPECEKGQIVRRKSRRGRNFYGCNAYPECKFVLWNKPISEKCPSCGAAYLVERSTKKEGLVRLCQREGCSYREAAEAVPTG